MEEIVGRFDDAAIFAAGVGTYMLRGYIADKITKQGRRLITKSSRNSAIWKHYQLQAQGKGHSAASVLDCGQEGCQVFGRVPQVV